MDKRLSSKRPQCGPLTLKTGTFVAPSQLKDQSHEDRRAQLVFPVVGSAVGVGPMARVGDSLPTLPADPSHRAPATTASDHPDFPGPGMSRRFTLTADQPKGQTP